MKPSDKFELRKHVENESKKPLSLKQVQAIAIFIDRYLVQQKKEYHRTWIGVRLFHGFNLLVLFILSFWWAKWYLTVLLVVPMLYNIVYFFTAYFGYRKTRQQFDQS